MFNEERKSEILNLINEQGSVKVTEISKQYKVSEVTIRKDLQELEEQGLVRRVHGGAVPVHNIKFEPAFSDKVEKFIDEKAIIGRAAAALIEDGDTLCLDAGTTTLQVAKYITAKNLTVITNSYDIAEQLYDREDIEVILIGGTLRRETRALVGPIANRALETLRADKAFIGANGVSFAYGLTTPNIIEANTKRQFILSSQRIIAVCDSTKFGEVYLAKIADVKEIHCIVTDDEADNDVIKAFEEKGVKILTAGRQQHDNNYNL